MSMTTTMVRSTPLPVKAKLPSKTSPTHLKLGRSYKAVLQVNTNIDSYDRTDPFLAFSVLLKLLGSLSYRVGGCQYKLTPDEHKLSLNLLGIVEPFVSLAPSRRILTRQPTEILDLIAFYVDSKKDLTSLGFSCKRMYGIVFPRHFDYRTIKCKVSSISVWNHLIMHRSLARNVRRLEILDERSMESKIIPPGVSASDTDLESSEDELGLHDKQERYLVSALAKMTALKSFSWSCNHSPISMDNVWPTLFKCHSLEEIQINDNLIFSPYSAGQQEGCEASRIARSLMLPDVRIVELRSTRHSYGATRSPALSRISGMLNRCPNLESLNIAYMPPRIGQGFTYPVADEFLLYSRWTHLTKLVLTDLRLSPGPGLEAAAMFLSEHHNIEILHLDIRCETRGGWGRGLVLPANTLPRLREIKGNKEAVNAILECPCDVLRPLETIKGVKLSRSLAGDMSWEQDQAFFASLRKHKGGLRRIELAGWSEMEDIRKLVECVPGLAWLDVGKRSTGGPGGMFGFGLKDKERFVPVNNPVEWTTLLSGLPELTTLHGIRFFYFVGEGVMMRKMDDVSASDRSRVRKNDEMASLLAWKCPKLRCVDYWDDAAGKVIVLVRNGNGQADEKKVVWEVRKVKV